MMAEDYEKEVEKCALGIIEEGFRGSDNRRWSCSWVFVVIGCLCCTNQGADDSNPISDEVDVRETIEDEEHEEGANVLYLVESLHGVHLDRVRSLQLTPVW